MLDSLVSFFKLLMRNRSHLCFKRREQGREQGKQKPKALRIKYSTVDDVYETLGYTFFSSFSFPCWSNKKSKALDRLCRDLGQEYKREGKWNSLKTHQMDPINLLFNLYFTSISLFRWETQRENRCNFRLHQLLNIYILVLNMFSNILCFQIWMKFIINLYP